MKKTISSILAVLAVSANAFAFYQETDIVVYSNEYKGNDQNVHDLLAQLESGWFVMTDIRPTSNRWYCVTSPVNYESGVNLFSLYGAENQTAGHLPKIEWDNPSLHMFKADRKIKKPTDQFTRVYDISTEDFSKIINAWENLLSPRNLPTLLNSKFSSEKVKQSLKKSLDKDCTNFDVVSIVPIRKRVFRSPIYSLHVSQNQRAWSIQFTLDNSEIHIKSIGEILY